MRGSVRKEGSTWRYVVDFPRGSDGRRRQKKKSGFRTKAEAERTLAIKIQKLSTNSFVVRSGLTIEGFLVGQWLPSAKQTLRPSTYSSYERNLILHVLLIIGGTRVQDLTAPMLNEGGVIGRERLATR